MNAQEQQIVQAFVDMYEEIDGDTSEMSVREIRLTQEFYPAYIDAKSLLGLKEGT